VTGGSSGIGLEIARQLARHGASVAITGRRKQVLDAAAEALRASGGGDAAGRPLVVLPLQGDVRSADACAGWVRDTVARFGSLHILVNCAAGNFLAEAETLSQGGFKAVMDIDALGTFTASTAALPALRAAAAAGGAASSSSSSTSAGSSSTTDNNNNVANKPYPVVINISATLHYGATWFQAHACAAKAAVDALTRSLALEWGEYGVRVVGVAPGPIRGTAGLSKLAPVGGDASASPGGPSPMERMVAASVPLGRLGEREDIAWACVYLASAAGRYVSGETLVVDGAAWVWRPPVVSRGAVAKLSRAVEGKSRAVGVAGASAQQRSKL
jgi:2,4-dienoyl-CoA reductase [(3E)-enoyl-CoA-producing], peroxisomal